MMGVFKAPIVTVVPLVKLGCSLFDSLILLRCSLLIGLCFFVGCCKVSRPSRGKRGLLQVGIGEEEA